MIEAFADGIALSFPATEIAAFRAPGSVFDLCDLDRDALSAPLRAAILVIEQLGPTDAPIRVVVRPEMFTHAETEQWLGSKLDAIADHVCISDGSTIRMLPGFRNHVFFYLEAEEMAAAGRMTLFKRAPELFATMTSQINSAITSRAAGSSPICLASPLPATTNEQTTPPTLLPLYLNRHSPLDSYARATLLQPVDPERFEAFEHIEYCVVTDRGHAARPIAAEISRRILDAYTRTDKLLLLWVPQHRVENGADQVQSDATRFLRRLAGSPKMLPRLPANNVVLVIDDPWHMVARALPRAPNLVIDPAFETWRFAEILASCVGPITYLADREGTSRLPASIRAVEKAFGRSVQILPLRSDAAERSRVGGAAA